MNKFPKHDGNERNCAGAMLVLFSYCWMSKAAPKPLVKEHQRSSFGLYPELVVNGTLVN